MQNIVISFWSLVQKFRKQYCTKTLVLYVPNLISSTECTCSWLFVCMFSKERLCLPFLDFLCPVLDARCQLPAHMHSLQTEPVSVFITSRHWTVKNRKCFSSSSHLHTLTHTQTHSHSHYLCHSLTLSVSSCLSLLLSCGLPHPLWVPKKA